MATCPGVCVGDLELTPIKVTDWEAPIWIYTRLAFGERLDSARPVYPTLSSADIADLVNQFLEVATRKSRDVAFESTDADFKVETHAGELSVEVSIFLGEPHRASKHLKFECTFEALATFANDLRFEQLALIEKRK